MKIEKIQEYVRVDVGAFVFRLGERRGKEKKAWIHRNGSGYRWWLHLGLFDMMV